MKTIKNNETKIDDKIISFVRDASSKSKNIGHNRFQMEIKDLNKSIDILNQQNTSLTNEKDNLETENKKYLSNIDNSNDQVNELKVVITKLQGQLALQQNLHQTHVEEIINYNDNLNIEKENLKSKHQNLINEIDFVKETNDNINNKYLEVKEKYKTLLDNFTLKTNQNLQLTETLTQVQMELLMYKENNSKLQIEIDFIKDSLDKIRFVNLQLQKDLKSKDDTIGQLHKKEVPVHQELPRLTHQIRTHQLEEIIPVSNKGIKIANGCLKSLK